MNKIMINIDDLERIHKETTEKALETMMQKNHDYTIGSGDVFANFRSSSVIGVDPKQGILIRVLDKIKRLATYNTKGELKVSESAFDSIEDIINYMVLLKAMILEEQLTMKDSEENRPLK